MSLRNIFYKLAHDVSRYPNIVQLTNTLDHGFKEVAGNIQSFIDEIFKVESADITTTFTKDNSRSNKVRKQGNVVTLDVNITGVTADIGAEIAAIPEGYRISDQSFIEALSISGQPGFCEIRQNGKVVTTSVITSKTIRIHTSWIIE